MFNFTTQTNVTSDDFRSFNAVLFYSDLNDDGVMDAGELEALFEKDVSNIIKYVLVNCISILCLIL